MAINPATGKPYTNQELAAILGNTAATQSAIGGAATGTALGQAESFDASKAVNQYAQGAWGSISSALGEQLKQLSGSAVGAGRFDSGYFDQNQGTVVRSALNDFSNQVAQRSVEAAGLQEANTQFIGREGEAATERGTSLYGDLYTQSENDARDAAQRKRARRGGIGAAIGGALGAAGGALFGAPTIGASIGSALGGAIGGY